MAEDHRIETDSMGEVEVAAEAYWGAQTQRAIENFQISGIRFPREFIRALGMVKQAAAEANMRLGLLDGKLRRAIVQAAKEVADGKLDEHFPLNIFQTGSGTSTNMNANEVIANRANELLGGRRGEKKPVHPNDHVNLGQSSNDVIPSCIHIAALQAIEDELLPALRELQEALASKAKEFDKVIKIGRTHLQDATPIRLGQEFSGYASMIEHSMRRIENTKPHLSELAIGGTAVGTGMNTQAEFARLVVESLNEVTDLGLGEAENHFEAQASMDAVVEASSALKCTAVSLMKIANDIRWLGSGPRCGIGEIILPELLPGSSIMPGKVNPVIPEVVMQVAAQVIGNDAAIAIGGQSGNFELNAMMPLLAYNLLQSIGILANAASAFAAKCIDGLQADEARCAEMVERSLALAAALAPRIGYDAAAEIAKEAHRTGKTVREIAKEKQILPEGELDRALDPRRMTGPG